jgi:cysteine synthase
VKIGLADPHGAALYSFYKDGELKSEGTSISEGIGQGRITANLEGLVVDHPFRIPDEEMLLEVSSTSSSTRACAWAARRASTSPARSAWPRTWVPATPS